MSRRRTPRTSHHRSCRRCEGGRRPARTGCWRHPRRRRRPAVERRGPKPGGDSGGSPARSAPVADGSVASNLEATGGGAVAPHLSSCNRRPTAQAHLRAERRASAPVPRRAPVNDRRRRTRRIRRPASREPAFARAVRRTRACPGRIPHGPHGIRRERKGLRRGKRGAPQRIPNLWPSAPEADALSS